MLDQPDFIARYDKHDALGVVAHQPGQLRQDYPAVTVEHGEIRQIVVAGMGGSALGAEFVKSWASDRLPVPLEIVRDYTLPGFVGSQTLVVASSYSGNTEETLSAIAQAERAGAPIVVIASGGQLLEVARQKHYPYFEVPGGLQPRLAVLYGVRALVQLLESLRLLGGAVAELTAAAHWVEPHLKAWTANVPTADNPAKQIASELVGHPVVVYGGAALALPTIKWKIDCNENAKNIAFYDYLPEFNHNEFIGWAHPAQPDLKVVELRSNLDHSQVQRRFEVSNKLLSDRFTPIEVYAEGETKLQQMLWTLILGDFVSVYLAFLNGIDPTPVELIERLKSELS